MIVSGLDRMSEGAEVTPSNGVQPTVDTATSSNTSTGERVVKMPQFLLTARICLGCCTFYHHVWFDSITSATD
ncbi:hypothetical protein J4727_20075 [Providencia rettgeri]|uniref:Uncharacterized protein n=1 Tax=Providencia rettgeri TaxID=587 RepID=A0A939NBP1_PRORE|nr:hypothetical protein [Providencia rettgeri]